MFKSDLHHPWPYPIILQKTILSPTFIENKNDFYYIKLII